MNTSHEAVIIELVDEVLMGGDLAALEPTSGSGEATLPPGAASTRLMKCISSPSKTA
jgi:hypothetical protein